MALTKVKVPVAEISLLANTTTTIDIPSAGGNIDIDVAGVNMVDITTAAVTLAAGKSLSADVIDGETVNLDTTSGAGLLLRTTASQAEMETDSAHPLVLGANSLDALTIGTDAKVTLAVEGTAAGHLVTKSYVDTAATTNAVQIADVTTTQATSGSISLPTATGNDLIINWGVTGSISNTQTAVSFDTAFPNAAFVGYATRQNGTSSLESSAHINSLTTTGMNVVNSGGTSSPVGWLAIGY
jgi:hypothetical protein